MREARNIPFDLFVWIAGALAVVLLVLPTLVVVAMSFTNEFTLRFPPRSWSARWYLELFSNSPQILSSARASLVVIATPFVIRMVSAAAQQMNPALLDCAASLGASRVHAFFTITLPLIRSGVVSGAIVAFLTSIDHVPVSLMLSDPRTETLPIHLWAILESNLDVRVAAVSGVIVAATVAVMLVVDRRMFVPGRAGR